MTDPSTGEEGAARSPEAAFAALSDPVRVAVLRTLWDRARRDAVPFSELRAAVGIEDSGRFSYHLRQLTDHFVEKTDAGYRLRPAGVLVVDSIEAGELTDAPAVEPADVGTPCPECPAELRARYDAGEFVVDCPDCDVRMGRLVFPPRAVSEREGEGRLHAFSVHLRRHLAAARAGVCPFCCCPVTTALELDPDEPDRTHLSHRVRYDCGDCGAVLSASLGMHLLDHPAVVAFLHDHGVAPDDRPYWEFPFCRDDRGVTRLDDAPPRVELAVELGGDELRVTVDEDGAVRETVRVERERPD